MANTLTYNELLVELRFIGRIPEGQIVDVTNHRFQERDTWGTFISREITSRQSRKDTVEWLHDVISRTKTFLQEKNQYEQKTLTDVLNGSLNGIKNLAATYDKDDVYVNCQIMAISDKVNELIESHGKTVPLSTSSSGSSSRVNEHNSNENEYFDD